MLKERLMISSDKFVAKVCTKCGCLVTSQDQQKKPICPSCEESDVVVSLDIPYAFKLLLQEMFSMGISVSLQVE